MNLDKILILARKNLGGDMESSARSCLIQALYSQEKGDWTMAANRGLRSIAYSVGICHGDYTTAWKAAGLLGEPYLVF